MSSIDEGLHAFRHSKTSWSVEQGARRSASLVKQRENIEGTARVTTTRLFHWVAHDICAFLSIRRQQRESQWFESLKDVRLPHRFFLSSISLTEDSVKQKANRKSTSAWPAQRVNRTCKSMRTSAMDPIYRIWLLRAGKRRSGQLFYWQSQWRSTKVESFRRFIFISLSFTLRQVSEGVPI